MTLRALALVALLTGCALIVDPQEARVCRLVIAALEGGAARIEIGQVRSIVRAAHSAQGPAAGVEVGYRVAAAPGAAQSPAKSVACLFDPSRPSLPPADRLVGIETLEGSLTPARLYMLKRFWLDTASRFVDPEPVRGAHAAIEIPRSAAVVLQALIAALPQTALLALLAGAYALVYGLVGRINLAFGDIVVVGGYAALIGIAAAGGATMPGLAIIAAIALALWAAGAVSAVAGRTIFERLHGRAGQQALIASAALAIVLAEGVRILRPGGPRSGPPLYNEPFAVARAGDYVVAATPMNLIAVALGMTGAVVLVLGLARSQLGRTWRAAADDPLAASMLGVNLSAVHWATFAASGLLAGLGGAIAAISTGSLAYAGGLVVGLKALIAALLGGQGSIGGAVACGAVIGLAEALWSAFLPIEHREAMLFAALVLLLVMRPGGLFGAPALEPRR